MPLKEGLSSRIDGLASRSKVEQAKKKKKGEWRVSLFGVLRCEPPPEGVAQT